MEVLDGQGQEFGEERPVELLRREMTDSANPLVHSIETAMQHQSGAAS